MYQTRMGDVQRYKHTGIYKKTHASNPVFKWTLCPIFFISLVVRKIERSGQKSI